MLDTMGAPTRSHMTYIRSTVTFDCWIHQFVVSSMFLMCLCSQSLFEAACLALCWRFCASSITTKDSLVIVVLVHGRHKKIACHGMQRMGLWEWALVQQ